MSEKWEKAILMELEGLEKLMQLYIAFEKLAWENLEEYGDYIEPKLRRVLEKHLDAMHVIITSKFKVGEGKRVFAVNGLIKDYEDVFNEVEALQAGKPNKEGVQDEGVSDSPPESDPDTPPMTYRGDKPRRPRRRK